MSLCCLYKHCNYHHHHHHVKLCTVLKANVQLRNEVSSHKHSLYSKKHHRNLTCNFMFNFIWRYCTLHILLHCSHRNNYWHCICSYFTSCWRALWEIFLEKKTVTRILICTTFGVRKQYWGRFESSGMWCCVTGWIVPAVLKALWSFKTAGTACPMTHDPILEDFNLHHLFVLIRVFQTLIRL